MKELFKIEGNTTCCKAKMDKNSFVVVQYVFNIDSEGLYLCLKGLTKNSTSGHALLEKKMEMRSGHI